MLSKGECIVKILSAVFLCARSYISGKNTYTEQLAHEETGHDEQSEERKANKADIHGIQETEWSQM